MSLFGNIVKSVAVNATIEVVDNVMKNQQAKTYIYTILLQPKNYLDVKKELEACGFTNISLLPIRDLIKGWFVKDGSVEEVIINGKDSFKKK